jgi:protein-S-isoprenylcysteine O-methyltransferase Ste14
MFQTMTTSAKQALSVPPDSPEVIAFPPALFLGTFFFGLMLHGLWRLHIFAFPWLRLAGAIPIIFGVFLAGWGRRTMVRKGTNVAPSKPALAIVIDGPFRFTRNPLYLGAATVYVGLAVVTNSMWPLLLLLPMLLVLRWGVIAREERYLEQKFGDVYVDYKARVPRWL